MTQSWAFWAFLSAAFAALTAIFGKVGVAGVNSDLATLIRTVVIFLVLIGIVTATGQWQSPSNISAKTWVFLGLSGIATGGSWIAYYRALKIGDAARVAPIDKLSIVMVAIFAAIFLGEKLSLGAWAGVAMIGAGAIMVAIF
ncbi:transporter [Rhizobium sp. ACO-34A]|nr:EamA family transporter [Rhizobium sp. ACO-34A]ATN34549.1 transporter [Rhizobium sp. ACO-34A]